MTGWYNRSHENSAFYMQWVLSFSALHSREFLTPLVFPRKSVLCSGVSFGPHICVLDKVDSWLGCCYPAKIKKSSTWCFSSSIVEIPALPGSTGKAAATGASPGQERAFAPLGPILQSSAEIASVSHQPRVPC